MRILALFTSFALADRYYPELLLRLNSRHELCVAAPKDSGSASAELVCRAVGLTLCDCLALCRELRPQALLCFDTRAALCGGTAARLLHIPHIISFTNLSQPERVFRPALRFATGGAERVYFSDKRRMLTCLESERCKENALYLYGQGVNCARFTLAAFPQDAGRVTIAIAGTSPQITECEPLKSILSRVAALFPEAFFVYLPTERDPAKDVQLEQTLSASQALLLPEYCPHAEDVLLTAFALGRSTVAPRVPRIRELVRTARGGLLFEPHDAASMESSLKGMLALSPYQRSQLGAIARSCTVSNFDRAGIIATYEHEINRIRKRVNAKRP